MNANFKRTIKQHLIQESRRLEKSIQAYQKRLERVSPSSGDDADHVVNLLEQSHTLTILEQLRQQLNRVEAARRRVAEGKYGICVDCHRAIPAERLKALPYATLCVRCQSQRERGPRSLMMSQSSLQAT